MLKKGRTTPIENTRDLVRVIESGRSSDLEIQDIATDLTKTPGWYSISPEKQERMIQRASKIQRYRKIGVITSIAECKELIDVENDLKNEQMTLTSYIRSVYKNSERTARRRLADYRELIQYWPPNVIEALATDGMELLKGSSGVGTRDLLSVAKELPAPKTNSPKVIEGFIENDVRQKLKDFRRSRKKRTMKLNPENSLSIGVRTISRLMRQSNIDTSAKQRDWLQRLIGMVMQLRAIPGTVSATRTGIPDGFLPKRGRPRNPPRKTSS
jgi:hypothetical protein